MSLRTLAMVGAALAVLGPAMLAAQSVGSYNAVTEQRLLNPEPQNWLMYRGNYSGWGYSPLETPANVKKLVPVWSFSTGVTEGHQAPPIVNDGVMFITTPQQQVIALRAKTGELIWRYKKELPEDLAQLHPTNRGVALWEDRLFVATVDAHLIALDAKTGKVLWDTTVDDYKTGYYFTLAPLVAKGKVMVGTSGGELGIRGYIAAFDVRDGKQVWKTHTIPGPGEPGHETWQGEAWKTGGVSVWLTAHYDPQLNLTFWGTGNAAPWPGDMHPGDNLYSSSVIALDADTGRIRGHHQYHWNDSWDWDEVSTPLLIDFQKDGRLVKGLVPRATTPSASRVPAPPSRSVPACGAARTGRRRATARRRTTSTSPPTRTCAARWSASRGPTSPASSSSASIDRRRR